MYAHFYNTFTFFKRFSFRSEISDPILSRDIYIYTLKCVYKSRCIGMQKKLSLIFECSVYENLFLYMWTFLQIHVNIYRLQHILPLSTNIWRFYFARMTFDTKTLNHQINTITIHANQTSVYQTYMTHAIH
jgi:hypothetical protein